MDTEQFQTIINERFAEQQQALNDLWKRYEKRSRQGLFFAILIGINLILVVTLMIILFSNGENQGGYLYIGSQRQLLVNQVITPSQLLIPKGLPLENNEIDEYIFEFFPVFEDPVDVSIQVVDASRKIGDINNPFNELLMIQIYTSTEPDHTDNIDEIDVPLLYDATLETYTNLVYVKVFLGEPLTENAQEAYEAISGKKVSFSLLFEVTND